MVCMPVIATADDLLRDVSLFPPGIIPFGRVFWVASNDGSDLPNYGTFDNPFDSVTYALTWCKASRGDIILCKLGHIEPSAVDVNVGGVQIIGIILNGSAQENNSARIDEAVISADNVLVCNMQMRSNGVDAALTVTGDGATILGCFFRALAPTDSPASLLKINSSASDCSIIGNYFQTQEMNAGEDADSGIVLTGGNRNEILNNRLSLQNDGGPTTGIAGIFASAAETSLQIVGNTISFMDVGTLDDSIINLAANTNGIVAHNATRMDVPADGIDTHWTVADCGCCENFLQNANGETGGLVPTTVST